MEEEVREILRNDVDEEETPAGGLGSEIAALFAKIGLASDIPELAGQEIHIAKFKPRLHVPRTYIQSHGVRNR